MIEKCTVISIGDELLIGQVVNTNAAWISEYLTSFGIRTTEHISVSDTVQGIHDGLDRAMLSSDLITMTGGLGPTKDDITKVAISSYFGLDLEFNAELFERIKKAFAVRNIPIKESHRLQCYLPKGIKILNNQLGTAPGMMLEKDGKFIISMPGVPYEMKNILTVSAKEFLSEKSSGRPYFQRTLMTSGMGETSIAELIEPVINEIPEYFKVAYLPSYGSVRIRLSSDLGAPERIKEEGEALVNAMKERLNGLIFGYDDLPLSRALGELLISKSLLMATAESCTGGNISRLITSEPGSSDYFAGSIIAYANTVKEDQLRVSPRTLEEYGAVSEPTVIEMLRGLLMNMKVDVGISVSGIAGPNGGTPEKPVGTIWIAYGSAKNIKTKKIFINRNREVNIQYASHVALNLLRKFVIEQY